MSESIELRRAFKVGEDGALEGCVFDPAAPWLRFAVELIVDDEIVALTRADLRRLDLRQGENDDGCHAFEFDMHPSWRDARRFVAQLANSGIVIGELSKDDIRRGVIDRPENLGWVEWAGGLTLRGALSGDEEITRRVIATADGIIVGNVAVGPWLGDKRERPFFLMLSAALADGVLHYVKVTDDRGVSLPGSPVAVLAGADARIENALRGAGLGDDGVLFQQFAALFPRVMSIGDYGRWSRLYGQTFVQSESDIADALKIGVVVLGESDVQATIASVDAVLGEHAPIAVVEGDCSLLSPAKPNLLADAVREIAAQTDLVICLPAGARLHAHAAQSLSKASRQSPDFTLLYWDTEIQTPRGIIPLFFNTFDDERLLEQGYPCLSFAVSSGIRIDDADFSSFFHFVISLGLRASNYRIGHIPSILTTLPSLNANSMSAALRAAVNALLSDVDVKKSVEPFVLPAIRVRRQSAMTLAAIVWGGSDAKWTEELEDELRTQEGVKFNQIIIADRQYSEFVGAVGASPQSISYWSRSHVLNAAAESSPAEALLFIGCGVRPAGKLGVAELMGRLCASRVAAVAASIMDIRGQIRSAGVMMRASGEALNSWRGWPTDARDAHDDLVVAHEVEAASLDVLLVHHARFNEIGGFDAARFPSVGADLDYCLRARKSGYRILLTPHEPWLVFDPEVRSPKSEDVCLEAELLRSVWASQLEVDSLYNPNLGRLDLPRASLAVPPLNLGVRYSNGRRG